MSSDEESPQLVIDESTPANKNKQKAKRPGTPAVRAPPN